MLNSHQPYKNLGKQLKQLRERVNENLPEVSGALEINIETLSKIEKGAIRPSEEVLLLLITHFGVREDEASKLWALAGYAPGKIPVVSAVTDAQEGVKPMVMMMADSRIVYTDSVHVMVNHYGVVMNFMQSSGVRNQPMAVARVGMSKEHAKSVLKLLSETVDEPAPVTKKLAAPKDQKNKNK